MDQPVSVEWSKNKKIVVFTLVGTIVLLSGIGAFVPTVKDYIISIVKVLLEGIKMFL